MMEEVGARSDRHVPDVLRARAVQDRGRSHHVTRGREIIPADHANSFFMALRQPAGVVACFAPFNVPYILGSRSFTIPIAYGNTAVLKPSEDAPVTGGILLQRYSTRRDFRRACSMWSPGTRQPTRSARR